MRFLTSLVIGSNNKNNKIENNDDKTSIYHSNAKNNISFSITIGDENKKKKSIYRRWSSPFQFSKRNSTSSTSSTTTSVKSSTITSIDFFNDLYDDFKSQYRFAEDELICATKSQGSNYFLDDYYDAKEAIDKCIEDYQKLINHGSQDDVYRLNSQWMESLIYLTTSFKNLNPPSSV